MTAEGAIFGIRRRRACLGMPTDGGRRNTLLRCTNVWMWQWEVDEPNNTGKLGNKYIKDSIVYNINFFDNFFEQKTYEKDFEFISFYQILNTIVW